jgi:hypothetical protein
MKENTPTNNKYMAGLGLGLFMEKKANIVINNEIPNAFKMCILFAFIYIFLSIIDKLLFCENTVIRRREREFSFEIKPEI